MFIGHYAVGLASKRLAPRTSLGWLIAAPIALDLLWPLFLLAGIERVRIVPGDTVFTPLAFDYYPWSHSLLMSVVWGVIFGGAYWAYTRYMRGAVVIGLGVVSHWVLDFVVHRPDLPLVPGVNLKLGLALWNSVAGTVVVEVALFGAAVWLYMRTTVARDSIGRYSFLAFVLTALVAYGVASQGAVPPSVTALAIGALTAYLVPVWCAWFDAHRVVRALL
jgi:hypothetical protein